MSNTKNRFAVIIIIVAALVAVGLYSVTQLKQNAAAYLYGYPLVLMEQTRLSMGGGEPVDQVPNQFSHVQVFPDHEFREVVRPNNDTLYSIAWLDLAAEPLILSVPDTDGRYYVMPFMDAWTNVFAMVGKRTTGTLPGHYALTGPDWQGSLPADVEAIPSPTNMVWLLGRIQANGAADIANVGALQEQFLLTPLSDWQSRSAAHYSIKSSTSSDAAKDPSHLVENMSAQEFFENLSSLMHYQPAPAADAEALQNLARLNVVPGKPFDITQLNFLDAYLLRKAISITRKTIVDEIAKGRELENGWAVQRDIIGNYGTHYDIRAVVALIGLGALPPEEATYPSTNIDSQGQALSGRHRYKLHFAAGQTPPVEAFWSLSMYDERGFFIDNPIGRYVIGDRDELQYNSDGSLDILVQLAEPASGQSNWLPSPVGEFALTMRLYHPQPAFLDGSWKLPAVQRID